TQRMRPMLMTALSACIGLLPAAVSTGIGSQVQRPLAVVVVAGMLIGPVLLLVVAPALPVMFLVGGAGGRTNGHGQASDGANRTEDNDDGVECMAVLPAPPGHGRNIGARAPLAQGWQSRREHKIRACFIGKCWLRTEYRNQIGWAPALQVSATRTAG